jgi:basic amino acid/polyamine antiporter, APA family
MRLAPDRPQLMGPWMATALVMGVMIGSGVFLLPAQLAPYGWNGVAAWGLSIGGALALAFVIARLTQEVPGAEGPTGFVAAAFGGVAGFMIGWSYWISILVTVATLAVAAISYASLFFPVIAQMPLLPASLAVGLLWLVTLINLRGARAAGRFQLVTMAIKLIPMLMVIGLLAVVLGPKGTATIAPFPAQGLDFASITSAATLTLWALTGFESASIAAARVERPEVNIPRATIIGTALTGLLYLIVCSGIALTLPITLASGSDAPLATFVDHFWARGPALLIALFAVVSAVGAMNGNILLQGELPLALARQMTLPRWFAVTTANGTPLRALLLASVIASLLVLFNANKSTGALFAFLATLATSATLWLYLGCALAALRLGVARPVAALGLVYSLWALWGAGLDVSALSLVLMISGLPLYAYARREQAAAGIADEEAVDQILGP